MRCVSYTRTAPWKNTEKLLTIQEQNEQIAAYLKEHKDLKLLKKYSDRKNDETADEAFEQMVEDGMARKYDCIIVASAHYFGPSFPKMKKLIFRTLYEVGISFIVVDENFDTTKYDTDKVAAYIKNKENEMHEGISLTWRKNNEEKCIREDMTPYGYEWNHAERKLVKDRNVAYYVDEIFRRCMDGQAPGEIAVWLDAQKVDTPMQYRSRRWRVWDCDTNDVWDRDLVRSILRNPTYYGAKVNGRREIIRDDNQEGYITKEQFYSLPYNNGTFSARGRKKGNHIKLNPLALRIFCTCGAPLQCRRDEQEGKTYFRCVKCSKRREDGSLRRIEKSQMFETVRYRLQQESDAALLATAKIKDGEAKTALNRLCQEQSVQMRSAIAKLDFEPFYRVTLYQNYVAGEISETEYQTACEKFRNAQLQVSNNLTAHIKETRKLERAFSLKNKWIRLFSQYKDKTDFDRKWIQKYITRVDVNLDDTDSAVVIIHPRYDEWKTMILELIKEN